jgi:hypothetical protein
MNILTCPIEGHCAAYRVPYLLMWHAVVIGLVSVRCAILRNAPTPLSTMGGWVFYKSEKHGVGIRL